MFVTPEIQCFMFLSLMVVLIMRKAFLWEIDYGVESIVDRTYQEVGLVFCCVF